MNSRTKLDFLDAQQSTPLRFIAQAVVERPLRILLAQVHVDRFGIASLNECIQAHRGKRIRVSESSRGSWPLTALDHLEVRAARRDSRVVLNPLRVLFGGQVANLPCVKPIGLSGREAVAVNSAAPD